MKVLIVAATSGEFEPIKHRLMGVKSGCELEFLETGVGMVAMTYALTKRLSQFRYDFVVNIGIAGAIGPELFIGDVVVVKEDCFFELGAEDGNDFIKADDMGFAIRQDVIPTGLDDSRLKASIPRVKGITVNTVHGKSDAESSIRMRSNALVESMEGAAFYFVCEKEGMSCLQLRSVSNKVELRDREKWDIPLALERLSEVVMELVLKY